MIHPGALDDGLPEHGARQDHTHDASTHMCYYTPNTYLTLLFCLFWPQQLASGMVDVYLVCNLFQKLSSFIFQ